MKIVVDSNILFSALIKGLNFIVTTEELMINLEMDISG